LDNHATQQGANVGDCLYKDVSGADGKPDGKIDAYDQVGSWAVVCQRLTLV
jgi:hypothetical protein